VPSPSHPASPPEARPAGFSLYQFFAPGGLLSKTHPAYEFRRGQLQMAQAVEEALEGNRHLIVEAGTGTGKTLAYLLPVIRSGKRVIICRSSFSSKMSRRSSERYSPEKIES
jgi:ATP-dependent DNA helicase DinG